MTRRPERSLLCDDSTGLMAQYVGQIDESVIWTGYIEAPVTGTYTIYGTTDDGVRIHIDGRAVVDAWFDPRARGPARCCSDISRHEACRLCRINLQEQRMAPIGKTHRIVLAIGLLCLGAAGSVAAQGTSGSAQGADRPFMENAARSDMAEIQLSRIAQQKATRDDVKQLAGRMVQDHTRTSEELKSIAGKHSVTLPTTLDRKHQQAVEKLQGKTASADFDRQYLKLMLDDHQQAVSLFRTEARSGKNLEAKAFAAKTLPALEEHLQMVQAMSKGAGKPMAMGGAGAGAKPAASGGTARP